MGHEAAGNAIVHGVFQGKEEGKKERKNGIRGVPHVEWRMNPQKGGLVGGFGDRKSVV